jgi:hypothetical protein
LGRTLYLKSDKLDQPDCEVAAVADMSRGGCGTLERRVNGGSAPAAAVTRADATLVQMGRDGFQAHRPAVARAVDGKPVDQPHRVGVGGSISSFFLVFAPRCSAATIR